MVSQKITCQSIFIECFKPRTGTNTNKRLTRNKQPSSSPQRISLSDISWQDGSFDVTINDISSSVIGSRLFDFTLEELRKITNNCTSANYLGEGGFGAVYKGFIDDKLRPGLEPQPVAVKVLDLEGDQGHREWLAEVIFLGQLRHTNLVKLIGYCCENDQRMLVYEFMERGNLDKHLFSRCTTPLPWLTRMKIALGAAKGLTFLHEEEKPVIFRDFKGANILLSADYTAKLSDFGFARDGPEDDESHISTKNILGTKGYVAPEYIMTGHLTTMSDVYSFGVVLLELLTGRRAMEKTRPRKQQCLVEWARPRLKDKQKLELMMDQSLEGRYSIEGARRAALLAYHCLSHQAKARPSMGTVVRTLELILSKKEDIPIGPFVYVVPMENNEKQLNQNQKGSVKEEEEEKKKGRESKRHRKHRDDRRILRAVVPRAGHSDTELYRSPKR